MIDDDSTSDDESDDESDESDDESDESNELDNSDGKSDDSNDVSFSSFHPFIHRELERTPDDYNFKGDTVYLNRYDIMYSLQ